MTNEIEPVSKAAAECFKRMCEQIKGIRTIFYSHASINPNSYVGQRSKFEARKTECFAAFCRAVADQLDPREPPFLIYQEAIHKAYMLGVAHPTAKDGFSSSELVNELKKHGLLGDKQND